MSKMELIHDLMQQASARGSRSTALKPLGWALALLLSGTMTSFYIGTPEWIGQILIVLCVLTVLLYFFAYIYFMFTNVDALRSEKYSLEKMAIQKSMVGDDLIGTLIEEDTSGQFVIGSISTDESEEEK